MCVNAHDGVRSCRPEGRPGVRQTMVERPGVYCSVRGDLLRSAGADLSSTACKTTNAVNLGQAHSGMARPALCGLKYVDPSDRSATPRCWEVRPLPDPASR